jgi:peptide/nickel transport system substrate-binding protein
MCAARHRAMEEYEPLNLRNDDSTTASPSEPLESVAAHLTKERPFWRLRYLENLLQRFTPGERLLLYCFSILLAISTFILLVDVNRQLSVIVPAPGGTLVEGEIGPARFINPLLNLSQPDEDLSELVYSGLMRALPDGTVVPDLASKYEISDDGTTYTFTMRDNATFHDGKPVTSDDVLFTIAAARNPDIKSRRRADWEGVTVSAPDPHTIVFKLPHAYAPFIRNATIGILPKHLWQNVSAEEFPFSTLNTHPVGSGPYRIAHVDTDSTGAATRYELTPFAGFTLGEPHIKKIVFLFYTDYASLIKALNAGKIDAVAGVSSKDLSAIKRNDATTMRIALPRIFGVFFNQSHAAVLADASVRKALDAATDKQALVRSILNGYGNTLSGPIPPDFLPSNAIASEITVSEISTSSPNAQPLADDARSILIAGGWKFDDATGLWKKGKQELTFSLATADAPELTATADALATMWRAAGINVAIHVYPLSELNTSIIRPRDYDAILFGEIVGPELDLFAFWHSSQRNDPGLNLALYTNSKVDSLLADARATTDEHEREDLYGQFASLVVKDQPAVFLYSPDFIYIVPTSLQGIALGALTTPAERFENVYQWYTETQRVWNIFNTQHS